MLVKIVLRWRSSRFNHRDYFLEKYFQPISFFLFFLIWQIRGKERATTITFISNVHVILSHAGETNDFPGGWERRNVFIVRLLWGGTEKYFSGKISRGGGVRKGLWSSCLNELRHTHAQVRGCAHYFSSFLRRSSFFLSFFFFFLHEIFESFVKMDRLQKFEVKVERV